MDDHIATPAKDAIAFGESRTGCPDSWLSPWQPPTAAPPKYTAVPAEMVVIPVDTRWWIGLMALPSSTQTTHPLRTPSYFEEEKKEGQTSEVAGGTEG